MNFASFVNLELRATVSRFPFWHRPAWPSVRKMSPFGATAARPGSDGATVRHPDRFAVVVDRDPVQISPLPSLREISPRRDGLVRIGQVIGWLCVSDGLVRYGSGARSEQRDRGNRHDRQPPQSM